MKHVFRRVKYNETKGSIDLVVQYLTYSVKNNGLSFCMLRRTKKLKSHFYVCIAELFLYGSSKVKGIKEDESLVSVLSIQSYFRPYFKKTRLPLRLRRKILTL